MLLKLTLLLALSLSASAQQPQQPTADAIMAHVAANQDASETARAHYVYIQHTRVRSLKGHTLRCEEITDSRITPTTTGYNQQFLTLDGRLLTKGQYVTYNKLPTTAETGHPADDNDVTVNIGDAETDRSLVESMRHNLTETKSKDGLNASLFPLTTKAQAGNTFQLLAREHLNGREVFHITFRPSDKSEFGWKGDAYIDTTDFQPVLIRTAMARNIPVAVRTLLGVSVPGLGFSITYAPQPDGTWFPIAFGTEFKIKVLFFFSRQIIIDAQNRDFEKTHVTTTIHGAETN